MGNTRRLILVGLVFVIGFLVYHGLRPASWTSTVEPPPAGKAYSTVSYDCGPPYGKAQVTLTAGSIPPMGTVDGTPCGTRTSDRVMIGLDVILAAAGIVVTLAWPRHRADFETA